MAINNVPVRYDRQVTRQLQTLGELIVLVERKTRQEEESEAEEESTAQSVFFSFFEDFWVIQQSLLIF